MEKNLHDNIRNISKRLTEQAILFSHGDRRYIYSDNIRTQLYEACLVIRELQKKISTLPTITEINYIKYRNVIQPTVLDLPTQSTIFDNPSVSVKNKKREFLRIKGIREKCEKIFSKIDKPFKLYYEEHCEWYRKRNASYPLISFPNIQEVLREFFGTESKFFDAKRVIDDFKTTWILFSEDSFTVEAIEHLQMDKKRLLCIELSVKGEGIHFRVERYPMMFCKVDQETNKELGYYYYSKNNKLISEAETEGIPESLMPMERK